MSARKSVAQDVLAGQRNPIALTLYFDDAELCIGAVEHNPTPDRLDIGAAIRRQLDPAQQATAQAVTLACGQVEELVVCLYDYALVQFREGSVEDGQHLLGIRDMLLIQRRFAARAATPLEVAA